MTTPQGNVYYVTQGGASQAGNRTSSSQAGSSGSRTTTNISNRGRTRTTTNQQGATSTQTTRNVGLPAGVPRILGNSQIVFYSWIGSMIVVGFDEWHNYHILPRPQRFWYTSVVFGILILFSLSDAMVPLANALAIGYMIMLVWQYYNGTGQFAQGS